MRLAPLFALILCANLAQADVLTAAQALRTAGCGRDSYALPPLRTDTRLDRAAERWARGFSAAVALDRSAYPADRSALLHVTGGEDAATKALLRSSCRTLTDPAFRDVGIYERGPDAWLVLAAPYAAPTLQQAPAVRAQVLDLVNQVRSRGARCGGHSRAPAGPLRLSESLGHAAAGHAEDMASHLYLEHYDRSGRSPADRVRAAGYRESLVGENIAVGPATPEEVVQGWLQSPGHCENIMDPRFSEMGLAYAPARSSRHELYWVQVLAVPSPGL